MASSMSARQDSSRSQGLVEQAVASLRRRGLVGEVHVTVVDGLDAEFAVGKLRNCGSGGRLHLSLRLVKDGRIGFYTTTDPSELELAVDRAVALANLGEELELELPGPLPASSDAPADLQIHDPDAVALEPAGLVARVGALYERVTAVTPGAEIRITGSREIEETWLANTAGAAVRRLATRMSLMLFLQRCAAEDVLMLWDGRDSARLDDAVFEELGARVQQLYAAAATRAELPPLEGPAAGQGGRRPVVLAPEASHVPLIPLMQGLDGMNANRGISPLLGKVGQKLLANDFTLTDDPWLTGDAGATLYDDEGTPTARRDLVAGGVVGGFLHDLRSATLGGVVSTGNGRRGRGQAPRMGPHSLCVAPGKMSLTEMLKAAEGGLYVVSVIGGGPGALAGAFSHPVGVGYLIQDGRLAGRVKDVAIAGNVYEVLRDGLAGLEDRTYKVGGGWMGLAMRAPHMLLDGVGVSGG